MEGMVRGIGALQASAMENLWNMPRSQMLEGGSGIGGNMAMLEPGAGMGGGGNAMLQSDFGPFGQSFAGAMLQPDMSLNRDSSGMTALSDLQSLKASVNAEANWHDMSKAKAAQASYARANEEQLIKAGRPAQAGDPTTSPSSSTGGGVYAGAFPHADMVRGYIPDDLKDDPELMRIIAAGSHAESKWDVNSKQPGGGGRGLFQFDVNGGMGTGIPEHQLLGEAGARYQASKIVPMYADWYRKRAQSGLTDPAQVASWVAAMAEKPFEYKDPNSKARQSYISSYNQVNRTPGPTAQPTGQGDWVSIAKGQLGKAYVWGGVDERGFDCSGFAGWVLGKMGKQAPGRTTMDMFPRTQAIAPAEARPGDLVFYNMTSNDPTVQHVAVYLGDGKIIQSGGTQRNVNIADATQRVGSTPIFRRVA